MKLQVPESITSEGWNFWCEADLIRLLPDLKSAHFSHCPSRGSSFQSDSARFSLASGVFNGQPGIINSIPAPQAPNWLLAFIENFLIGSPAPAGSARGKSRLMKLSQHFIAFLNVKVAQSKKRPSEIYVSRW